MADAPASAKTFNPGDRVELHPATDLWMRGARFATVDHHLTPTSVLVTLDATGHQLGVHVDNLLPIE